MSNKHIFFKEAGVNFDFLVNKYQFIKTISNNGYLSIVKYTSNKVCIELLYGPPEWHVEISFNKIINGKNGLNYSLGELVGIGIELPEGKKYNNTCEITNEVKWLLDSILLLGDSIILGKDEVFMELAKNDTR